MSRMSALARLQNAYFTVASMRRKAADTTTFSGTAGPVYAYLINGASRIHPPRRHHAFPG
jgi:hypothetical protein